MDMRKFRQFIFRLGDKQGVTVVLVAIIIVVLLGFVALAVDVGYVMVTRNELQNVSDAASLAASRWLGNRYKGMSYEDQQTYNCDTAGDTATIKSVAQEVALQNKAATVNITVNPGDVIIGHWKNGTFTGPDCNRPDAVRVISRRDSSANGPISTFFGRILGIETIDVSATATAALTGESTAGEGGLPIPIAISECWFYSQPEFAFCNQPIRFYPTNDPTSCAGWHVFDRYPNAPDSRLRDTIADLETGSYESPETIAGQISFEFTGGTMSTQTFAAMKSLFDSRKGMNDGIIDRDENSATWTATVPVYAADCVTKPCANPTGQALIVGFATIVITGVQDAPVHQIDGYVICNSLASGRGSGKDFGTVGDISGLVQ